MGTTANKDKRRKDGYNDAGATRRYELFHGCGGEPGREAVRDRVGIRAVCETVLDRQRRLRVVADDMDAAGIIDLIEGRLHRARIDTRKAAQPSGASSSPGSAKAVAPRADPAAAMACR